MRPDAGQHNRAFSRYIDMSKTALKKEINNLNAAQLREMLLDMYDFRLTPKEYFSFFVNPDAETLFGKYKKAILTELQRGSYNNVRARITVINRLIRNFDSYKAGLDYNIKLKMYALRCILLIQRRCNVPHTLENGACRLLAAIIREADLNLSADTVMQEINRMMDSDDFGTSGMKRMLSEYMASIRE